MRKLKERRLADFVRSPASDAQLLELWSKVESGQTRRRVRTRQRRWGASVAVLGGLIGALALARPHAPALVAAPSVGVARSVVEAPPPEAVEPAPAIPTNEAPQQLSLADGSQLVLGAGTRTRVLAMRADEVRVRLEHGHVECEVVPDRSRRFILEAGEFEVVVTGTHFTVDSGGGASQSSVHVGVERGSVEVWQPPNRLLATLGAGQRWASERPAAAAARAPGVARPAPPAADAGTLLARASAARQAGKLPEAVTALERLIRQHPHDERAGYAAFLLGRIRLDSLGDARGAVEAFSFAAAHPGSGFFPEDAEARQVEALAKAGRMTECASARNRFVAKYPRSGRVKFIERACHEK